MFTIMVKQASSVKFTSDLEDRHDAFVRLGAALERIPGFRPIRADRASPSGRQPDGWFEFTVGDQPYRLQFVMLQVGYPKQVKQLVDDLEAWPRHGQTLETYTVLVAPWFSPETVKIAADRGYGTLDLSGNYRLHFNTIFLERVGETPSATVRRQLVSPFAPKSARLLRALLAVPDTAWKVTELAAITGVSQGLVSRVRTEAIQRGWIEESLEGVRLADYESLLRDWAEFRQFTKDQPWNGYTLLHGKKLTETIQELMQRQPKGADILLSGPSASQWLAPYLKDAREYFYTTLEGFDRLYDTLDLESEPTGNVAIRRNDLEVFFDRIQLPGGLWLTSPAQTFLDLHLEGERGEEAATHLMQHYLKPRYEGQQPLPSTPIRQQLTHLRRQG